MKSNQYIFVMTAHFVTSLIRLHDLKMKTDQHDMFVITWWKFLSDKISPFDQSDMFVMTAWTFLSDFQSEAFI